MKHDDVKSQASKQVVQTLSAVSRANKHNSRVSSKLIEKVRQVAIPILVRDEDVVLNEGVDSLVSEKYGKCSPTAAWWYTKTVFTAAYLCCETSIRMGLTKAARFNFATLLVIVAE